jgi:hypothetical protein
LPNLWVGKNCALEKRKGEEKELPIRIVKSRMIEWLGFILRRGNECVVDDQ